jgi:hypothetical protein
MSGISRNSTIMLIAGNAVLRLGTEDFAIDDRAVDVDPLRGAEDQLDLECFHRTDNPEEENHEHRRSENGDNDTKDRARHARAGHARCFFERCVEVTEGWDEEKRVDGDGASRQMREDDAPPREDIEHRQAEAGKEMVDEAVVRIEQQNPAQRAGQRGKEERDPEAEFQPMRPRNVGTHQQPGETDAGGKGDRLPSRGEGQRVDDGGAQAGLVQRCNPICQAESRFRAERADVEAFEEEQRDRIDDNEADHHEHDRANKARALDSDTFARRRLAVWGGGCLRRDAYHGRTCKIPQ